MLLAFMIMLMIMLLHMLMLMIMIMCCLCVVVVFGLVWCGLWCCVVELCCVDVVGLFFVLARLCFVSCCYDMHWCVRL